MSDIVVIEDILDALRDWVYYGRDKHPNKISEAVLAGILADINALQSCIEAGETEHAVAMAVRVMGNMATHGFMFERPKQGRRIISGRQSENRTGKYKIDPALAVKLVDAEMKSSGKAWYPATAQVAADYTKEIRGYITGAAVQASYKSLIKDPPTRKRNK